MILATTNTWSIVPNTLTALPVYGHQSAANKNHWAIFIQWKYATDTGVRHFVRHGQAGNDFDISYDYANNRFRVRFTDAAAGVRNGYCDMGGALTDGETVLIMVAFEYRTSPTNPRIYIGARSQQTRTPGSLTAVTVQGGELASPSVAQLSFGDGIDGTNSVKGGIMGVSVWQAVNTDPDGVNGGFPTIADLNDVWLTRRADAFCRFPLAQSGSDYSETATGVIDDATRLFAGFYGAISSFDSAYVGATVTAGATTAWPRYLSTDGTPSFIASETATVTGTLTYGNAYDESTWFQRNLPQRSAGALPGARGRSCPLKRFAYALEDIARSVWVLTLGNSRNVQISSIAGYPRNWTGGITNYMRSAIAGVLMQTTLGQGNSARARLGFDCTEDAPRLAGAGFTNGNTNFRRFGTGSTNASVGPGTLYMLDDGGIVEMRVGPDEGLMQYTRSLIVRVHVLAGLGGPNGQSVSVIATTLDQQGGTGDEVGDAQTADLSGDVTTLDVTASWSAATAGSLLLTGDFRDTFAEGNVVCFKHSSNGWDVNVVEGVSFNGSATGVTFEHDFEVGAIEATSVLYVTDDYSYRTFTFTMDAVDSDIWRGIKVENTSGGGAGADPPVIVVGWDAFTLEAPGIILGGLGWAGNNYADQVTESFSNVLTRLVAAINPDVLMFYFAQNNLTDPEPSMPAILSAVLPGAPDADLCFVGDPMHLVETTGDDDPDDDWAIYFQNLAATYNAPFVNLAEAENIGPAFRQVVEGQINDGPHKSTDGYYEAAVALVDGLQDYADCGGDREGRSRQRTGSTG